MFTTVDTLICFTCVALSLGYFFLTPSHTKGSIYLPDSSGGHRTDALILDTTVTHARLLPSPSSHKFTYPVLTFFFPLRALESHKLSLIRGWLLSYGGIFGRVVGLRATNYLYNDGGVEQSIRRKLGKVLSDFGVTDIYTGEEGESEEPKFDAWMMTMPAYFGSEGINPLTVYFCYRDAAPDELWVVVLEIHNTFGERHIHVLELGKSEELPDKGFDHQWTFDRAFHVSPFNDRLGTYTISVRPPAYSPSDLPPSSSSHGAPQSITMKPAVRVHLHEPPSLPHSSSSPLREKGPLKLTALHFTRTSTPLSAGSLIKMLLRYPIALFMSLPRILKHAWILHYKKGLGVWRRPEPVAVRRGWGSHTGRGDEDNGTSAKVTASMKGGGVGWQAPTLLESLAEKEVHSFLGRRAKELDVEIVLVPGDPNAPVRTFSPSRSADQEVKPASHLTISYLSPRLFIFFMLSSSASEALTSGGPSKARAGTITEFVVNDEDLFARVFGSPYMGTSADAPSKTKTIAEPDPKSVVNASDKLLKILRAHKPPPLPPSPLLERPSPQNPKSMDLLDDVGMTGGGWRCVAVLCLLVAAEWVEWWAWKAVGVRWAGIEVTSRGNEVGSD